MAAATVVGVAVAVAAIVCLPSVIENSNINILGENGGNRQSAASGQGEASALSACHRFHALDLAVSKSTRSLM